MKTIDKISSVLIIVVATFCFFVWPLALLGSQISVAEYHGVIRFLHEWQSFLAGLFAIGAAVLAAKPVWHQLNVSRIQTATAARDALNKSLQEIEERKKTSEEAWQGMVSDFMRVLLPHDYTQEPNIHPEWAWQADNSVFRVKEILCAHQGRRIDSVIVEGARNELIENIEQLSNCLNTINSETALDVGLYDEENISEEDISRIIAESGAAKRQLLNRIRAVRDSGTKMNSAFNEEIGDLLLRVRQMDNIVINASLIS